MAKTRSVGAVAFSEQKFGVLSAYPPPCHCPQFSIPSPRLITRALVARRQDAFKPCLWRLLPQLRAEVSLRPPVRRRRASGGARDALAQGEARRVGPHVLVATVPGERRRPRGLVHHACRRVEKGPARRRLRLLVAHGPVRPATPPVQNGSRRPAANSPPGLPGPGAHPLTLEHRLDHFWASESPRRSAAGESALAPARKSQFPATAFSPGPDVTL